MIAYVCGEHFLAGTPLVASAQPSVTPIATIQQYTLSGCVPGVLRPGTPAGPPLFGDVLCFGGTASQEVVRSSAGDEFLRFVGQFAPTFSPEFTGSTVGLAIGSAVTYTFTRPSGGTAGSESSLPILGFTVGGANTVPFTTMAFPPASDVVLGSVRDVRARMFLEYRLPGDRDGNYTIVGSIAFTPVPEPSTFALAGVGGLVLAGAGAVRRRRAAAR